MISQYCQIFVFFFQAEDGIRDIGVTGVRRVLFRSQAVVQDFLTPTNQYLESNAPWKLVKTDKEAAKRVLFNAVQSLRVASILLKPFIPRSAEAIYTSFNFPKPWAEVRYADAAELAAQPDDLRVTAELVDGKPKPLFPRIG